MTYINAGHYPPVLMNGNKLVRLKEGCTVIGAFEKLPEIREEKLKLDDESLILCFTDGLVDMKGKYDEYFEDNKIEKFVRSNHKLGVKDFNNKLMEEIEGFIGDRDYPDDIAILTCKVF